MVKSTGLALLLLATPVKAQMVGDVGVPIGTQLAGVVVEDLDGNAVDLGEIIGRRPALFEFWATWCENCEALAPHMEAAVEQLRDSLEFVAIGVGVGQNPRSIRRHLQRHPSQLRYLYDARGAAVRRFQAPTTSFIAVLDSTGTVTYTGVGPDQDVLAAARTALP